MLWKKTDPEAELMCCYFVGEYNPNETTKRGKGNRQRTNESKHKKVYCQFITTSEPPEALISLCLQSKKALL